jgi:hypothetical protein
MVRFTLRPLYLPGKSSLCEFSRRLDGPQSRSGRFAEEKNLLVFELNMDMCKEWDGDFVFQFLTAVGVRIALYLYVTPCSLVDMH